MIVLFQIQIDEQQLKDLYMSEVKKRLDQLDKELTFWDVKELKRQTNMSWNTMQDKFFHHPEFPKFKVGQKWYFPAAECRAFLIRWAKINRYNFKKSEKEAI